MGQVGGGRYLGYKYIVPMGRAPLHGN